MTTPEAPDARRIVTVIGLGAVGQTLGLALARVRANYRILGHDRDADRVKAALQAGAIDQGRWNVRDAVAEADLVVLTEPLDQLIETLAVVAEAVPAGALITDTASTKAPVLAAARRLVPEGVSFIGGHPVLRRVPGADWTLTGATYCLMPLAGASDASVRVMTGLVEALGAHPLYIDAAEHDALVAAVVDLPELLAAALTNTVERSPSSRDLRRLAGPGFLDFAYVPDEGMAGRSVALLANAEAVLLWLDQVQHGLATVRSALVAGDGAALEVMLTDAAAAYADLAQPFVADEREAAVADELKDFNPIRNLFLGRWGRSR
jgi:prephenate dehydrogenase